MLGNKTEKSASPSGIGSLIGAGTRIDGEILYAGSLRIDGEVNGRIRNAEGQTGALLVGEQGCVTGEISGARVVINGAVRGPISTQSLELQPLARVVGDLNYQTAAMRPGAVIDGALMHRQPGSAEAVVPLLAAAS